MEDDNKEFREFEHFREYIFRTTNNVVLEGNTQVQAVMGGPKFIPFHIPHSSIQRTLSRVSPEDDGGEITSAVRSLDVASPPTTHQLYKSLKEHDDSSKLKKEEEEENVIVLPPPERKTRKTMVKVRMQKKPYLKRFPEDQLGSNDEIDFKKLIKIMREKVTDENYYLVHTSPKKSRKWNPFNFRLVPSCKVNPQNFYSVCRKGIFQNRFGVLTFRSLDELEMSYDAYMKMKNINFCKQLLLIKVYKQWKRDVWKKRWLLRKCDLESYFLYSKKHLRDAIYDARFLCSNLSSVSFFDDSLIVNIAVKDFPLVQDTQTRKTVEMLFESHEFLRRMLKAACEKEMDITKNLFNTNKYILENLRGSRFKFLKIVAKKPGSYAISQGENEKRKLCTIISRGIKTVDYIFLDALFTIHKNAVDHFLSVLKKHLHYLNDASVYASDELSMVTGKERTSNPMSQASMLNSEGSVDDRNDDEDPAHQLLNISPMFPVKLYISQDLSRFKIRPDLDVFMDAFESVFKSWAKESKRFPSFLEDNIFECYTSPVINGLQENNIIGSAPRLHDFLEEDVEYQNKKKLVMFILTDNYEIVKLYTKRLNHILEYFKWCHTSAEEEIKKLYNFDPLREIYNFTKNMVNVCHEVTTEQDIGLFDLDMKDFKQLILPTVECVPSIVGKTMADIYVERFLNISNELITLFERLETEPKTCAAYLLFTETLDEIKKTVARHEETLRICQGFEETIQDAGFGDHINETHQAKARAENYLDNYQELFEKASQKAQNYKERFVTNVYRFVSDTLDHVSQLRDDFLKTDFYDKDKDPLDIDILLQEFTERIEAMKEPIEKCKKYERAAELAITIFTKIEDLPFLINLIRSMWDCKTSINELIQSWFLCDFDQLNPEEMQQTVTKYLKNIAQYEKYFPPNNIVPDLRAKVEDLRDKIPCINVLRNPNVKPRHWRKIGFVLNAKLDNIGRISLHALEKFNIYDHYEAIADISVQASSESSLEGLLKKVEDAWKNLEFTVIPHKDSKDVYILSALDDINAILDETNINLTTISSSRSVGPIKPRVDDWVAKIDLFSKTLEEWSNCQTNWLYLEPIFSAPDIQRQLPNEAKMFFIVDKSWKQIMRSTAKNPLALQAATVSGRLEEFERNNALLEEILKCLEAYLESKRVVFPRFYFLSNEELLEILAQTRNPHAVQPHLKKCFDAIEKLGFAEKFVFPDGAERYRISEDEPVPEGARVVVSTDILSMMSPESEVIKLPKGLKARGNVEEWLGKVEAAMFTSLYNLMKFGIDDFTSKKRTQWVLLHASQIVVTVSQIMWAKSVHLVLSQQNVPDAVAAFEQKCFKDLGDLASMVRGKLEKTHRQTLCALITIDVHARDIITGLIQLMVDKSSHFEWIKQLRYYWDSEIDNCVACMASARHIYGYEYLGVSGRLVITPLTDKCYLCLMGALQLDLGGAPAGPAGTGKTETTKDLAKALAIQCVVFNCSDGLDYKMMGRFFSGLAQSGAWCCFDEFNRIDIEVLSVIAQQLITIRNAKAAKLSRFMFEGREIKLIPQCATFITMNPGYAGRTELPDNLKSVFRPFAMMVPDYRLIAEVVLYSEGFESSKGLAQKMVNMYKLCSEQLSQQDHYDFGMRAVKSVLVMAGSLKRENPDKNEDVVLIRALRDSNLPKFLKDDADLFKGILNDLFPGVVLPEHDYGLFQKTMEYIVENRKLQSVQCTFTKTIQLYETMVVRWGVMTVGPTGGGKTTVLNVLKDTLTKLFEDQVEGSYYRPVTIYTLNPKSVTMGELYGEVNLATLEWKDGLLGIFVRKAVRCTEEIHQWVVCDGPVDAVWIENMNTVLDDNKMLCLANSERIKLTAWVHMVFEVQDLSQASPATVSRCGMVYVDHSELGWLPFVKTWAHNLVTEKLIQDENYTFLVETFETYIDKGLEFIQRNCSVAIHQVDISKIAMLCSLLQSVFKAHKAAAGRAAPTKNMKTVILQAFVVSYIWSLGGNILENNRDAFGGFVKEQFAEVKEVAIPESKNYWQFFYDAENKALKEWASITPDFKYNPEVQFFDMLVPTIDTVCFGYLMRKLLEENHPVFFTGTTGVGKSVIAKEVLNSMTKSKKWVVNVLNFSAQTSSMRTQEMIELKLEKKKKTLLGAPYGKRMAVFVDDVNMPKLEIYGAQAPIELLRQFLDFKGLYDRDKLFWKNIDGMVLSCACAPPGGGRNPLTPRFVRHFGMLLIPSPSIDSLRIIFSSILKGFLEDFVPPIPSLASSVVWAAVDLYQRIAEDLLPTPAKSHYVFNLRDLSKCIQGVLQANNGVLREPKQLYRLFFHECSRVFHDRLINEEDKSYFLTLLRNICLKHLKEPVVDLPEEGSVNKSPPILLYGDFMNTALDKKDRIYDEITDIPKLKSVLQDAITEYNLVKATDMKLIFFMDALEHLCRLVRILRAERGNALLVGVGGMGKQSLTKLASHLNQCNCFQIELTQTYDYNSFHEDLRKLYFNAGGLNQDSVFLFTDTQILIEEFVEDINNILNSGEVPNLFEGDELEKCIIACRPGAKEAGVSESSRDAIFDFFISRVRSRLHVVLCMSPVGDAFRRRCRMFPSLVNCCTIDWFMPWPEEALVSVAQDSLKEVVEPHLVQPLSQICFTMHSSVENASYKFYNEMKRHYYVTPSSYLDLLKLYGQMLDTRKKNIASTRERINNGLLKLYETNDLVASMKIQLQKLEPELAQKNEDIAKLMTKLVVEKTAADEVRTVVLEEEAKAKEKAGECQILKDDAQADLDLAMPAMEAAVKALEALNKRDIDEVKVFNKPPYLVKFVMESVCLLLGAKQDWPTAKLVLGDTNFLKKLQEYDKDHIPDSLLKKLKTYIDNPQYVPHLIEATSKACKSLCLWVRAIDTYAKVYRVVEPKKQKLDAAEKELNGIMSILRAKQAKLADVEAQIHKLESFYDMNLKEKAKLEATLQLCKTRMNRAGRLTSALSDEQERWEKGVKTLTGELDNVVGDVLVAAASVAYLGAFTSTYREELNSLWLGDITKFNIPASESFSLMHVLADPYEISVWNSCGLPSDKVSVENGIYVTRASRWPLMIDPQEQANRWIRQMEADNNLRMVKLTDANFMRVLESSIRLGLPILIWEVGETLDPTLKPVLTKSVFYQAGRALIRLGDSDIEYDKNFRLYVTTKLANPHYLPEICIQVTLVNFTVTPSGLEDQLLGDVVRIERPDLEKQRSELIVRINKDKGQLKSIEDKILKMLFASSGNILDDEELVETLNESKETSAVITTRLQETEETEAKITVAREGYRSVAERGSVLYFVVAHLAEIDPMYQFSLKYFKMIFNNVIENTPPCPKLDVRLLSLMKEITLAIYNNVSRGLFEKDKLVFSFMLCANILIKAKVIKESNWVYLLRGPVGSAEQKRQKPDIPAVTNAIWSSVTFLEDLDEDFANITENFTDKITLTVGDYTLAIALKGAESRPCPVNWNEKLDLFRRMMIIKALKEEKVIFAVTEYVKVMLGKPFVESPLVSLNLLYADMNNITPLVFVLSTGSDPVAAFLRFAAETGNKDRINSISLGQGQGPIAAKMIERGKRKGDWVFLQNCHLAASWMLNMEKIIMDISDNPRDVHTEFRLFLSSMPSTAFPVSVLQNSVKVTNEPPKGLRSNLKRAFTEMQEDFFEGHPLSGKWRKMIFGICFFHAVILERKKYGPLGWNIMYEFSESDRECALLNLNLFCAKEKRGKIPWDALEYITGEITYGGRVTDFWDQRTLKTVLKKFFSPVTLIQGYKYSSSGTYYAPESAEIFKLDQYRQFIEDLPLIEEPEIFGMHENANIAFQTKETSGFLGTILNVEVKESGGAEGKSSDEIVSELAENIEKRITHKISTDDILSSHMKRDGRGRLPSLTTVLLQEVDRFNKMLRVMHASIDNLKKAIKGFVVMSDLLEEVYKAFMNNMVPKMWSSVSYPSLKSLGSWIRDLELRIEFIIVWVNKGQPSSFWLSGFFFPQGFMTGVLQNYARKYDFPIDELKVDFSVRPTVLVQTEIAAHRKERKIEDCSAYKDIELPEDGVLVHGLFLDAARFDLGTMLLADPYPGELNPPLPALELVPSGKVPSLEHRYQCPLYKTSIRAGVLSTTGHSTNFVIAVLLPTDQDESYWILKGTALLTQVTD